MMGGGGGAAAMAIEDIYERAHSTNLGWLDVLLW